MIKPEWNSRDLSVSQRVFLASHSHIFDESLVLTGSAVSLLAGRLAEPFDGRYSLKQKTIHFQLLFS